MFKWLRRAVCGIPEEQIAKFCAGRSTQSDEQFLLASGLPPDAETARVAIAVRRAVANIGAVDPQFVRPDDAYPDQLAVLPLWDSMDWFAFRMELEEQLGDRFSHEEFKRLFDGSGASISVKEMVDGVQRVLANRRNAEHGTAPDGGS